MRKGFVIDRRVRDVHRCGSDRTVAGVKAEARQLAEWAVSRRSCKRSCAFFGIRGPNPCEVGSGRGNRYPDRVEAILSVLQVVIAVVVIFLVLMHSGKDAGLSGAFGVGSGAGPLGGGSLVERNLNRWTVFFAVLFFINAIILLKAPWA